MRPTTSGIFQKWFAKAFPGTDVNPTPALIQFAFSNPLIDVVLVGMRTADRVRENVALYEDRAGRVDIGELYRYYDI
jgi:aryl-alcohol dehydrogenase-like predicted oxidoreductase